MAEQDPRLGMTMGDLLDRTAQTFPDRDALAYNRRGERWTWSEFRDECDRVARGLIEIGVGKGSHVAIWATSVPEWVVTQFATAKIGAVLVTVNPNYQAKELEYLLKQSDTSTLVLGPGFRDADYVGILKSICKELDTSSPGNIRSESFPELRNIVLISRDRPAETPRGLMTWSELLDRADSVPDEERAELQGSLSNSDPINIQYTSGTTGFPKGAVLSHANLVSNAYYVTDCLKLTEKDSICIPVPFYHCFGCVLGLLGCVLRGAKIVPVEFFDPLDVLESVAAERCTVIYGVPTMFITELDHPDYEKFDLSSLRTGIMAGAPCPIELMKMVVDIMGVSEMTIAYGQTEASPAITQTSVEDSVERRVTTVGRALPGVEVKVADPGSGLSLPAGEQGELCGRGHIVMLGYYNMPEATAQAIDKDGWLHTGDLAVMDEEGYCRITGRIKDMIIRGGENVYPREVEELLYTHPKVSDVQVFGIPDARMGEEVAAWVKLKEGESATAEEIRTFCKGKVAGFKIPRQFRFVKEYPMTVTGKIQKFKMREIMVKDLGLETEAGKETA